MGLETNCIDYCFFGFDAILEYISISEHMFLCSLLDLQRLLACRKIRYRYSRRFQRRLIKKSNIQR